MCALEVAAESQHQEGNCSIRTSQNGDLIKWDQLAVNGLEIIQIVGAEQIKRLCGLLIEIFYCFGYVQVEHKKE